MYKEYDGGIAPIDLMDEVDDQFYADDDYEAYYDYNDYEEILDDYNDYE